MDSTHIMLIIVGLFLLAGAGFDWNWFMEDRRALFFTKILGNRMRARIFYGLLGVFGLTLGLLGIFGITNF